MTKTARLAAGATAAAIMMGTIYYANHPAPGATVVARADGLPPAVKTAPAGAAAGAEWFGNTGSYSVANVRLDSARPTSEELSNPYTRALLYQGCDMYFETKEQLADDIATANRLDPSGKAAKRAARMAEWQKVRCEGVTPNDIKRVDELMAQAARAGNPGAQAYMLEKDLKTLEASAEAGDTDGDSLKQRGAAMLSQAADLVKRGELSSARIAVSLTVTDEYGQADKIAFARWLMLSVQHSGQPFNMRLLGKEQPAYQSLSPEEYNQALQQAQAMFASCCAREQNT